MHRKVHLAMCVAATLTSAAVAADIDEFQEWKTPTKVLEKKAKLVAWDFLADQPIMQRPDGTKVHIDMKKLSYGGKEKALALKKEAQQRGIIESDEEGEAIKANVVARNAENAAIHQRVMGAYLLRLSKASQADIRRADKALMQAVAHYQNGEIGGFRVNSILINDIDILALETDIGLERYVVDGKEMLLRDIWKDVSQQIGESKLRR